MKKLINLILVSLVLLVASTVFAGTLQPNQATVKGLSLASSREKVEQVMGKPYRTGHWEFEYDTMYEYPGVNFVFLTEYGSLNHPITKIILDAPQVAMDNGLKVGVSTNAVMDTLGTDYKYDAARDWMIYSVVIDPVTYKIGYIRFETDRGAVKRIFIERAIN